MTEIRDRDDRVMCSIGIDIASIERLKKFVNDDFFLDRLLTDSERQYIFSKRHPHKHLAGRFAAKEAVMKALGTGWGNGIDWKHIEIVNAPDGRPEVRLHSGATVQDKRILLSISYTNNIAVAFAVIEDKI